MSWIPLTEVAVATMRQFDIQPEVVRRTGLADEQVAPVIRALEAGEPLPTGSALGLCRTFIRDGLLYREFGPSSAAAVKAQLVVPSEMRTVFLRQLHNK